MSALTTTEQMVGNGDKWGYVASLSQVISHRNIARTQRRFCAIFNLFLPGASEMAMKPSTLVLRKCSPSCLSYVLHLP